MSIIEEALGDVEAELRRALKEFPGDQSPAHFAHSVLREEVEELWDRVKDDVGSGHIARKEACQISALAVRYMIETCDGHVMRSVT